jgi:thiamine biosynthesis lipoprotein
MTEARRSFECFGSTCTVLVTAADGEELAGAARALLLGWHDRFTRFDPDSELSRLNADNRATIPVTPMMARLAAAVADAALMTGGLVDGTLLDEVEEAGYRADLAAPLDLPTALMLAPPRHAAGARSPALHLSIDFGALVLRRPPGLRLDGGGLAKGLFADAIAETLGGRTFAIDCAGDVRIGGQARRVDVESPFDGRIIHRFELADAGVATSGVGRRSWLDGHGEPAHHLLDPATGRPAFTGIVQATAIAPTALEAEIRAKAALLSGPGHAADWLPDGGVIVLDDGDHLTIS